MTRSGVPPSDTEPEPEFSEYEDDVRSREDLEIETEAEYPKSSGSGGKGMRWLIVFFLFIAFVFMAFVAASPVSRDFYIFAVKLKVNILITKIKGEVRFGVWGYCSSGLAKTLGVRKFDTPDITINNDGCHDRKLGWTFKDVPGLDDSMEDAISGALTTAFVLHIVAAVMLLPALLMSVIGATKTDKTNKVSNSRSEKDGSYYQDSAAYKRRSLSRSVALFVSIGMIFVAAVFILDLVAVLTTRNTIKKKSKGIANLEFGPAFWCVVASFGLVLLSLFLAIVDSAKAGKNVPRDDAPRNTYRTEDDYGTDPREYPRDRDDMSRPASLRESAASQYSEYDDIDLGSPTKGNYRR